MTQECFIGLMTNEGLIRTIRLKNGGGPEWTGMLLNRYFNSHVAYELISLGDLKWLGLTLEECQMTIGHRVIKTHLNITSFLSAARKEAIAYCYVKTATGWDAYNSEGQKVESQVFA